MMLENSEIESSSTGSRYSPSQVRAYYERIDLPEHFRYNPGNESASVARDPTKGLDFLKTLQQHHLSHIPFENLDLHYNRAHAIYIDPPHLYDKIVGSGRGRGGYCMESNGLFGPVLRSLGFDVYATGARVYQGAEPTGKERQKYNGWCVRWA